MGSVNLRPISLGSNRQQKLVKGKSMKKLFAQVLFVAFIGLVAHGPLAQAQDKPLRRSAGA